MQSAKSLGKADEVALVATEGAEGVLDTGASRTVVGSNRVKEVLQGLDAKCRAGVRKVASSINFRFGNSGTLRSKYALLVPRDQSSWIRVEVIPGDTPLLVSNRLLRELDAVVHVKRGFLQLPDRVVPMRLDGRGLSIIDLSILLQSPGETCYQVADTTPFEHTPPQHRVRPTQPEDQPSSLATPPLPSLTEPRRHAGPHSQGRSQASGILGGCAGELRHRPTPIGARGQQLQRGADQLAVLRHGAVRPSSECGLPACLGQETLPSGKHKGLTFKESFDKDMPYAAYMARKTTLTSAWARSYQNFAVAMFKSMARAKLEKESQAQQEKQNPDKNKHSKVDGQGRLPRDQGDDRPDSRRRRLETVSDGRKHGCLLVDDRADAESSPHRAEHDHGDEGRPDGRPATRDHDPQGAPATGAGAPGAVGADFGENREVRAASLGSKLDGDLLNVAELCQKIDGRILQIEEQLGKVDFEEWPEQSRYKLPQLGVLEITFAGPCVQRCVQRHRGRVISIPASDLGRIWKLIHFYEPRHLWIQCGHVSPILRQRCFGLKRP